MNKKKTPRTCWVPTCLNQNATDKKFFNLPTVNLKLREIWLALATKPTTNVNLDQIFFCQDHFEGVNPDVTINGLSFKLNEPNNLFPNKNMPDKICRTCNTFVENKQPLFIMSNVNTADIPAGVLSELKNTMVAVKPEPLHHVFTFCFKDFVLPVDPIPLVCGKCFYNLWLFFAFKKRAIEVEDFLGENLTPEKYGTMVLCRTCPDSCSNFFPLGRDSELGIMLQTMFVNNYSPDVVPLRVCLNCYNVLQKISVFHKNYINTDEIIKRRAILNAKLKMNTFPQDSRLPSVGQSNRQALSKKVEKENLILAHLMLQFGQALRDDLHNIENWNPVCMKLQQQGINHKVPSLITTWKKLTGITQTKLQNNTPLSDLEKLVCKYYEPTPSFQKYLTHQNVLQSHTHPIKTLKETNLKQLGPESFQVNEAPPSNSEKISNVNLDISQNRTGVINFAKTHNTSTPSEVVFLDDSKHKQTLVDKSSTPFSQKEKLELIDVMVKYKAAKGVQSDPSAFCDIWPEVLQILRDRGSTRSLESIQETWYEIKQSTQKAVNENNLTDEVQKCVANFLYPAKNVDNIKTVDNSNKEKRKTKRVGPRLKKVDKRTVSDDAASKKAIVTCDKPKSVQSTYLSKRGRPTKLSPEVRMQFVKAMIEEFDKVSGEETINRGIWKILVRRVSENQLRDVSFETLLNLWGRLKLSATIHEKDGKDPLDLMIWNLLQKYNEEKPDSPVKRTVPTPSIPPTTINKPYSIEESDSVEPLKKPKLSSAENLNVATPINVASTSSAFATPSSFVPTLESTQDTDRSISRQLLLIIKEAYEEVKALGLLPAKNPWILIMNRVYEKGFKTVSKSLAQKIWLNMRQHSTVKRSQSYSTPLMEEVRSFLRQVHGDKAGFIKQNKSPSSKKLRYEVDRLYAPSLVKSRIQHTTKEDTAGKIRRKTSLFAGVHFDDVESVEEGSNNNAGTSSNHWTLQEKSDLLVTLREHLHAFNSNNFWLGVEKTFTSKGHIKETTSIKHQWSYLKRRTEQKVKKNVPLNDLEKEVETLIVDMLKIKSKDIIVTPVEATKDTDNRETQKNVIKNEVVQTSENKTTTFIDLTSYDYVSLEDLQQSSAWDMPELKPMIEPDKVKFEVSQNEGNANYSRESTNKNTNTEVEEEEDSNDAVIEDPGYVGASDLVGVDDIIMSDGDEP